MCPPIDLPLVLPLPQGRHPDGPHFRVEIELRDDVAIDTASEAEGSYAAGLQAMSGRVDRERYQALEHLRDMLGSDDGARQTSAALLLGLLSVEFGDARPLEVLNDHILENDAPDAFVAKHVAGGAIYMSWRTDVGLLDPLLTVSSFFDRPLIAFQIGLAGSLLMRDQLEEAADVLKRIVGPAEASVTKAHESVRAGGDFDAQFMVIGVEEMLCRIYRELDRPDAVLEVVRRFPNSSLDLQRAEALEHKGLEDAALLVYSAYLEAVEREISTDEERGTFTLGRRDLARYAKARLLIADDRLRPARAELARLYADSPDFEDSYRLRAKLERPPSNVGRKAIPEDVRHAVWRRDEGRCTQCSSQEDLEFDHIIPLSRGGSNAERNLQLLCERCNREKGATI